MALVTKRAGAPAGTIKASVGGNVYTFDDAANLQVDVLVAADYNALIAHPYFQAVGGGGTFTPTLTPRPVTVLADGTEPAGTVPTLQADGSMRLKVGGTGGVLAGGDPMRFDTTRLGTLRTAINNRASAPVRVLALGDSIVEGDQNTVATRWFNVLAGLLRTAYPTTGSPAGLGFVPALNIASNTITNPIVYTGTKAATSGGLGGGAAGSNGRIYQMSGGATATLTFTGTGVDIVWLGGTTGGNFTWAVDGGGATTVSTTMAATAAGNVTQVRGLSAGSHTIVLTNVTSNLFFEGFVVYNGDEAKGWNFFEAGHAGATSADAIQTNTSAYDTHRMVAPHLVLIEFGTNDWGVGNAPTTRISPRAMSENLHDLIAAVRSAETDPSIILIEPARRGTAPATQAMKGQWADYIQMIRKTALSDSRIALFDRQAVMGDQSAGGNTLVGADKVHPNTAGHAAIAAGIRDLITSVV